MQTKQSFPASTLGRQQQQQRDEAVATASSSDAEEVS